MRSAELPLGDKKIRIEIGRVAKQAAGECVISYGDTVLLVCVTYNPDVDETVDFLPLTVDYRELLFAAGKIPGGFFKREGRPSENEILTSRLIDRPLRALFPKDFRNQVQIIANLLSSDIEHEADTLGIIGAATALLMSEIPYTTPVAAVKVGLQDGNYIINPGVSKQEQCLLNLVIAGTKDAIVMIEGEAREVSEQEIIGAIEFAHPEIQRIIEMEENLLRQGGNEKVDLVLTTGGTGFGPRDNMPEAMARVVDRATPGIAEAVRGYGQERTPRSMLSRGQAGMRGSTLMVNLPGSKRRTSQSLDALFPGIVHAFSMMAGRGHDEGDKEA